MLTVCTHPVFSHISQTQTTIMAKLTAKSVLRSASGMEMPILGLGTWQSVNADLEKAINTALEVGYRLIDTAFVYNNEEAIGRVLSEWLRSGKISRKDIFITTKLPIQGNNPKFVREYLLKQLKALQLDYVDLYLIHHPVEIMPEQVVKHEGSTVDNTGLKLDMTTDHVALWKEMEKQVDDGLTKAIGLSNFNVKQIERILKVARIPPANLQIELYLYNQGKAEQQLCKKKGITITSYCTLGSLGAPSGLFCGANLNPLQDPVVCRIAKAHNKSASQVLLRHVLQLGIAIIPKSSNPKRISENFQVFDFELSATEMEELNNLDEEEEGRRFHIEALKPHPE
ncbi:hypothetical protein J6590_049976 [Homalodisca vitripennis]|nr:hypothetical protein J6590_049976 [Homalodisca vitripennis]